MLKLREAESRQRVREEAERLARIEARLKVASLRGIVPTPLEQGILWRELEGYLAMHHVHPAGPCLSLYRDDEYKEREWDIEVCEPLSVDVPPSKPVFVQELPLVETMACAVHAGTLVTVQEAYDAILRWMDESGYQIIGPIREVYLKEAKHGSQTDPMTVTEIQIPVSKP